MQFNKYTKLLYGDILEGPNEISKYFKGINRFIDKWNAEKPPPMVSAIHDEFLLPFNKNFSRGNHYNILYIISKTLEVKMMWRNILEREISEFRKGLWIIGDYWRVGLTKRFLNYYFRIYYEYYNWLTANEKREAKEGGYLSVRSYASNQCKLLEDNTYITFKNKLVYERWYEMHLEGIIMEGFKLDYKSYRAMSKEYYYAISKHFHNKRMVS